MRNAKRMAVIVAVLLVFGALSIGSGEEGEICFLPVMPMNRRKRYC